MAKGLKHLSHRLIPFFIAGLTVLVTVTASNFSLLHPQAVNAQQVIRGNGKVVIQLPSTELQDDDWSCGPNSAARVLKFYGFNSTYDDLRRTVKRLGTFPGSNRLGTAPHELRNAMSRWAGEKVKLEREANFERLLSLVSQGKPVITLVRIGTIQGNRIGGIGIGGTWPAMHWFVVNGFDQNERRISITDTTIDPEVGSNRYTLTYDDFMSQWSWGIGRGAASSTLDANGVKTRTMVWVDRTYNNSDVKPVFDAGFYLLTYGDLRNAFGTNQEAAKHHWLTHGIIEGRRSSAAFDVTYYLGLHSDLQQAFGPRNYSSAINHWLTYGIREGRRSSVVFDVRYYLGKYPDLQNAFGSSNYSAAVDHWLRHGVAEGRQGSAEFNPRCYMSKYPDVARVYGSTNYQGAIAHYLEFGRNEGRSCQ